MSEPTPSPRTYSVQTDFDIPATMRDGTVLRANVFRPIGDGPFPVLLSRTPYGKDLQLGAESINPIQAAKQGYIVVLQDTRGRFGSAGDYRPFLDEREDGYDAVEWAAALPNSSGLVGMTGGSYVGFTQWAAAREQPPHLKALFPNVTWADSSDGPFMRGGAIELGITRHWTLLNALDTSLRRTRTTGDPRQIIGALKEMAAHLDDMPEHGYAELPVKGFGQRRGYDYFDTTDESVDLRNDPERHDRGSVANGYDDLNLPAFHMGGWYDIFLGGTLRNFAALTARGVAPQKLIIGPWSHTNQSECVGAVHFGLGSSAGLINMMTDLYSVELRWFDRWLKDIPNGIENEPPIQIFVMGTNQWRTEQHWPLARAVNMPYYLHSDGHANTRRGNGTLSPQEPGDERADTFDYDPQNPMPTLGGATMLHPLFQPGPQDQRPIERRDDMLVFTSAPMDQPMEVTGLVTVHLFAATNARDTDFVARLVDVHPDGFARNLTDGILRGRFRQGLAAESLLTPHEVYEYVIDLWATSNVFLAGHRIRVDITSSSFPRWDRNLNTDAPLGEGTETIIAHQTILHNRTYPSRIVLPIIPAQ